ncbi:MAG: FtsX-like permease family protein [Thermoanaerobaculales bacterium]
MKLAFFLASRLLRRRGTALLRTSALAAMLAVSLGAASMVVALALMSGYAQALRAGVLAAGGHLVVVYPSGLPADAAAQVIARLATLPGVERIGEVAYLPGMLFPRGSPDAEVVSVRANAQWPRFIKPRAGGGAGPLALAVGGGVARRLGLAEGDTLTLQVVAGGGPRSISVRVAQVFATGFTELDERWVATDLADLRRRIADLPFGGLELFLRDPDRAGALREAVEAGAGKGALVTTWQEGNRNLFAALRWQKLSLGLVLSLVLGVGAFEVASALVVLITEKRREMGVLLALGIKPRLLRHTLLLAGGGLGSVGVVAGMALGIVVVVCLGVLGVPHFSPEIASIYMVDTIPFRIVPGDLVVVLVLSLTEVLLAASLPARRAARREPVEALRWV